MARIRYLVAMAAGVALLATAAAPAYGQARPILPPHPTRDHLPYVESDCASGDPVCITQTIAEMYRRLNSVIPVCDHRAAFSLTYLRVTEEWHRRLAAGVFEHEAWTGYIDRVFANLYFSAYDAYAAGRLERVPPAWELAFDTARRGETSALGNFILEFNAHVNRDLPFAIARVGTTAPDGASYKPDYDRGNDIVIALAKPVLDELVERFDPTTDDLAIFPLEQAILQVFLGWRERTWRNAELLLAAPTPSARAEVAAQIERQAVGEGHLALESLRYRGASGAPARNAWCALHGGQQPAAYEPGAATLQLTTRRIAVRRSRAPVTLACPEPTLGCSGTVAIMQGRRTLGRRRYQVEAGEAATVRVPVRRAARGRAFVRLARAGSGLPDLRAPIRLSTGARGRGRSSAGG